MSPQQTLFGVLVVIAMPWRGAALSTAIPYSIESNESELTELLDRLFSKDNRFRPGIFGGPSLVYIDFYVQSFWPLDGEQVKFAADLDFHRTWQDARMTFEWDSDIPIHVPSNYVHLFWVPDIYFPNEKYGASHYATTPNKNLRIYPNGTIRYFSRMTLGLSCSMDLKSFPLDEQVCEIKISSYSYDTQQIVLKWFGEDPIDVRPNELKYPQFEMNDVTHGLCNETYKKGEFSCLSATFLLKRKIGFFVLQTFVPSLLVVMLSWIGFWINKNSEPARVALGMTTVLTMSTQLTSSRSSSMSVSYLNAIDVWYTVCLVFVFGALIEYAFVNASARHEKKFDEPPSDPEMQESNDDVPFRRRWFQTLRHRLVKLKNHFTSKSIDQWSRRLFPLSFLVFNIIFWTIYAML